MGSIQLQGLSVKRSIKAGPPDVDSPWLGKSWAYLVARRGAQNVLEPVERYRIPESSCRKGAGRDKRGHDNAAGPAACGIECRKSTAGLGE